MEAKELRIGNIVRSKANGISKVEQIGSSINSEYVGGRSLEGNYWENSYLPIPLTEEWLLNFGFEMGENKSWENFNFGLTLYKDGDYFEFDQLPVFIFLKYVHQLQNLYFTLTGEELTLSK